MRSSCHMSSSTRSLVERMIARLYIHHVYRICILGNRMNLLLQVDDSGGFLKTLTRIIFVLPIFMFKPTCDVDSSIILASYRH